MRPRPRTTVAAFASVACLAAAGCGVGGADSKPSVVATTTQLGDFARAVAGDAVAVHQILHPNTDPHEYEPRPSDIVATARAKVVLMSGDGLDSWMNTVVDQAGGHPRVVDVGAAAVSRVAAEAVGQSSKYDPHWWHDPRNAIAAVGRIERALSRAVPADSRRFRRNAAAYVARLRKLDAGIKRCFAAVPAGQRKLVTSHDAFNYFAKRYGVRVVGAIVPSQSTEAQPSAGDVARLASQIRHEHVHAVFLESSVNPKLARAVAGQTHTIGNLTLYGDTLGPAGSSAATYIGMEQANADAMVRGFSAGRRGCSIPGLAR